MAHVPDFRQGSHICTVYDTPEEQLAVAVQYLADGLEHNERCLYAAPADALAQCRRALGDAGVDVAAALQRGALLLLTTGDAHLVDGRFDGERMLQMLNEGVEAALNAGFAGLRTCGDMSWLLDEPPGSEQMVEYEALLNQFFANVRGLGMCQYDRARLPDRLLDRALATHPSVVIDRVHTANPFYREWPFADADPGTCGELNGKLDRLRSTGR